MIHVWRTQEVKLFEIVKRREKEKENCKLPKTERKCIKNDIKSKIIKANKAIESLIT